MNEIELDIIPTEKPKFTTQDYDENAEYSYDEEEEEYSCYR